MTFGSLQLLSKSRGVGGPEFICGKYVGVIGDTTLNIDLSSHMSVIKACSVWVNGVDTNANIIDFTTIPSTAAVTIPDNGYQVEHLGTVDMSSGFDWGTTNQQFSIDYNGGGATMVTLNTLTTDVATTVTEIDAELTTAGLNAVMEAYSSGNYVGIRSVSTSSGVTFVLAAGAPSALGTLGWTAGTYTNVDAIELNFTAIGY